jgi:hypothetical protein
MSAAPTVNVLGNASRALNRPKIRCAAQHFALAYALIVAPQDEPSGRVVWFADVMSSCTVLVPFNICVMGQE